MSDVHADDVPVAGDPHGTGDHGDEHGHDDPGGVHAHADESLGPIDVAAWGAGLVGIAISVVIAACFVVATSLPG